MIKKRRLLFLALFTTFLKCFPIQGANCHPQSVIEEVGLDLRFKKVYWFPAWFKMRECIWSYPFLKLQTNIFRIGSEWFKLVCSSWMSLWTCLREWESGTGACPCKAYLTQILLLTLLSVDRELDFINLCLVEFIHPFMTGPSSLRAFILLHINNWSAKLIYFCLTWSPLINCPGIKRELFVSFKSFPSVKKERLFDGTLFCTNAVAVDTWVQNLGICSSLQTKMIAKINHKKDQDLWATFLLPS